MTRAESISQHIAKRILANKTRKGFSTLYSEALQEIQMSTVTTSNDLSKNFNGKTAIGSPADGKKFNNDTVQNSQVAPVIVKANRLQESRRFLRR